jgi:hypothetical protein
VCLLVWAAVGYGADATVELDIGGYTKGLLVYFEQHEKDTWINLERLRLDLDLDMARRLQFKLIYDHELILGNELDEFQSAGTTTFWDLDKDLRREGDLHWRHIVYRAYARYYTDAGEVILGRQRIAWGVARLWNPMDLFNPISPLQIEGAEKLGVDAARLELHAGALSSLQLVFAPQDRHEESSAALRCRTTVGEYDLAFMVGEFREDEVLGLSVDGYVGNGGLRAEFTYTDDSVDDDFVRAVIGADYTLSNGLYILAEYLYNGGAIENAESSAFQSYPAEIITRYENFAGLGLGYDLTPLIRLDNYVIYDIDQASLFVGPSLSYSVMEDLDWTIGLQLFSGRSHSEFGGLADVYYTQLQWFF